MHSQRKSTASPKCQAHAQNGSQAHPRHAKRTQGLPTSFRHDQKHRTHRQCINCVPRTNPRHAQMHPIHAQRQPGHAQKYLRRAQKASKECTNASKAPPEYINCVPKRHSKASKACQKASEAPRKASTIWRPTCSCDDDHLATKVVVGRRPFGD